MNKRKIIQEAMESGKMHPDGKGNGEVISDAVQYYSDLVCEAIFPMNNLDTPFAIAALEMVVGMMRKRPGIEKQLVDEIKACVGIGERTLSGDAESMEMLHQKLFGEEKKPR